MLLDVIKPVTDNGFGICLFLNSISDSLSNRTKIVDKKNSCYKWIFVTIITNRMQTTIHHNA